jgi:O-antigen/teichoic acid export membrane protein
MSKKLITDASIYGLGSFLNRSIGFLLIPLYTRVLDVEDYGALNLLNLILNAVILICMLGIGSASTRSFFQRKDDKEHQQAVYGTATLMLLVFPAIILTVIGTLFAKYADTIVSSVPFYPYILVVLLIGLFAPLMTLVNGLFRCIKKPILFITFNLSFFLLQASLIIISMGFLNLGLSGQIFSQLVANVLFGLLALTILWRYSRPRLDKDITQGLLAFGIPLIPYLVFVWINGAAGRFALERFHTIYDVGIFALAAQFSGIMILLATAMDNAFTPHFLEQANNNNKKATLGKFVFRYYAVFGLLGLFIVAGSPILIRLVSNPEYHVAVQYVSPLTFAALLIVFMKPVGWAMTYCGRSDLMSLIWGGFNFIFIILLWILLGYFGFGIMGVIYAMLAANGIALIVGHYMSLSLLPLTLSARKLFILGVILTTCWLFLSHLATNEQNLIIVTEQSLVLLFASIFLYKLSTSL